MPLHFPGQIIKSPQVLSHLLLVVAIFPVPHPCAIRFPRSNRQIPTSPISSAFSRYSAFSQFTSFSCWVSRCASALCLPWEAFATADCPARYCGGEQFPNGCHRFPKSNRQISTSPISSALQWSLLPHPAIRFPKSNSNPHKSISSASGCYSAFSHFTSFSCCVSCCASPLCLPGEAFSTADRPARSEQWSFGGEQFQAPPRWDTTGAIDFPSQIVKSPHSTISSAFSGRYFSLATPMCH